MKGMYYYLLAGLSGVYAIVLIVLGYFENLGEFVSHFLVHPGDIVLLSRLVSASLGTFSIYLLFRLGKKLFPDDYIRPSLLLALGWSTCGLAVWVSKWGLIETALVMFGILSFFPILNVLQTGRTRDYLWSAVWIAAATATKIYGLLLFLPLLVAHLWFRCPDLRLKTLKEKIVDRNILGASVVLAVLVCMFNPSIPNHLFQFGLTQGLVPEVASDAPARLPLFFYFSVLRWNVGNLAIPFLILGGVASIWKRQNGIIVCASFAVIYFLLLGLRKENVLIYPRYLLLSLPLFFVVTVYGLEVIRVTLRQYFLNQVSMKIVSETLVLGFAGGLLWNGLTMLLDKPLYGYNLEVPVHARALSWFEQHVPQGAKVLLLGEKEPWPGNQTLPLFNTEQNYLSQFTGFKNSGGTQVEFGFLVDLAQGYNVPRYDLIMENQYSLWGTPETYIKRGVQYFVVDVGEFQGNPSGSRSLEARNSRQKFYQELGRSDAVFLLKRFEGRNLLGVQKTIEVYQVGVPKSFVSME